MNHSDIRALLEKIETCDCGDVGYYIVRDCMGEPSQEQCQFCYENENSLFNFKIHIQQLLDEVDRYDKLLKESDDKLKSYIDEVLNQQHQLTTLQAKYDKAIEALRFYGDGYNYRLLEHNYNFSDLPILLDEGNRARRVIGDE